MKSIRLIALMLLGVAALCVNSALAQTGNGAPSGAHYNLNIIGHDNCPGGDFTGSNRHTIHVALNAKSKINLTEGDFQVLDGSACAPNDTALFQLPAQVSDGDLEDPTFQEYWVYARALGKPGGSAVITTCAYDPDLDETVCSTENTVDVLVRGNGKSSFQNVTKELTTVCLDTDDNTVCDTRVDLFSGDLEDWYWDYDNNGLRLAQLRFYPIPD